MRNFYLDFLFHIEINQSMKTKICASKKTQFEKKTQAELAELVGVAQGTLSNISRGHRRASWALCKRLALLTKTDPVFWKEAPAEKLAAVLEATAVRLAHNHQSAGD